MAGQDTSDLTELWSNMLRDTVIEATSARNQKPLKIDRQILSVLDRGNQFFYVADYSIGKIVYVSPNIAHVLGYAREEFDLRNANLITHPEDARLCFEIVKAMLENELPLIKSGNAENRQYYLTFRIRRKDGKYIKVSATASLFPVKTGHILHLVIIRDISHIFTGSKVTFSILGGKPVKELPRLDNRRNNISKREQEIIFYISKGLSSKRIASELGISMDTVTTHRRNIMRKTGVTNMVDLVLYASRNGII